MFDETNNTEEQEMEFPENLFGDDEPETKETTDGGNHTADTEEKSNMLRIKYNGEERDITLDEARVLAQKGLNYDHVLNERDTKYQRELRFLDKVAAEQGMTRSQYIALNEKSPAKPMREGYNGAEQAAAERALLQVRRMHESAGFSGPWSNLFRKYPELSRGDAYTELSDAVRRGMTPLEAYQAKLLDEKENALKIAKNNGAAASRSVGSLEGDGGGAELDDFLTGFYSV